MAAKLDFIIPKSNFELVRDRIALILKEELDNQALLQGTISTEIPPDPTIPNPDLVTNIFIERFTPPDKSEGNVLIVKIADGRFDNQAPISQVGSMNYFIDIYTNGEESQSEDGYFDSSSRLQRLAGLVRSIIQNPVYDRLSFANGIIQKRSVSNIQFADVSDEKDAVFTRMARVTLSIDVYESQTGISAIDAEGYDTQIKIALTNKGYKLTYNNI